MELSKIVQEWLQRFDKDFGVKVVDDDGYAHSKAKLAGCDDCFENVEQRDQHRIMLISSQISLLEAELERKNGLIKEIENSTNCWCEDFEACNNCLVRYGNKAIQEDITYLTEQLELIKKMV